MECLGVGDRGFEVEDLRVWSWRFGGGDVRKYGAPDIRSRIPLQQEPSKVPLISEAPHVGFGLGFQGVEGFLRARRGLKESPKAFERGQMLNA